MNEDVLMRRGAEPYHGKWETAFHDIPLGLASTLIRNYAADAGVTPGEARPTRVPPQLYPLVGGHMSESESVDSPSASFDE